jgi:small subunit ribosomal protein S8
MAEKDEVEVPYSRFRKEILDLLVKTGYLNKVSQNDDNGKKSLKVELKYYDEERPAIKLIELVSKPGRRIYKKADQLKPYKPLAGYKQEMGIVVISTSKGLMTTKQAREKNIGGQVLFKIS